MTVTRWEYRIETASTIKPSVEGFNTLGAEGWQLCGIFDNGFFIFKRVLAQPADKP